MSLSPVVDTLAAPALRPAIPKVLQRGRSIAIDATPVERIIADACGGAEKAAAPANDGRGDIELF